MTCTHGWQGRPVEKCYRCLGPIMVTPNQIAQIISLAIDETRQAHHWGEGVDREVLDLRVYKILAPTEPPDVIQ